MAEGLSEYDASGRIPAAAVSRRVHRRGGTAWSFGRVAAVLAFGLLAAGQARADQASTDAVRLVLDRPSHLTPRAVAGLFTDVTRAGDRLVAVGERGRIVISDDNGATWRQVETPTSVTLTKVSFVSPQEGWTVGDMGIVLHSMDGGLTWTKQFDGVQAIKVATDDAAAEGKQGGNNATATADVQAAQQMAGGGPSVPFLALLTQARNNIIIAGAFGMAFSSNDGGVTWHSLASSIPDPDGLHIYDFAVNSGTIMAAGEQGLVLRGSNGGPFTLVPTPFQGTFFGDFYTKDNALLLYGLQGTILRSTDQGAHWATISTTASVGIDCGMVLKDGSVLLGDVAGELLSSHDNGQTFTTIGGGVPVVGLTQAADGTIIVVGPGGPQRVPLTKLVAGA